MDAASLSSGLRVAAACLVSLAIATPAPIQAKSPEFAVVEVPAWRDMRVSADAPVLLKWRGGFFKDTIRLPAGATKPVYQLEMEGRSFALVQADYWDGDRRAWISTRRSNDLMEGCYLHANHYIAVDTESRQVSPIPVIHREQFPESCRGGLFQKGPWSLAKAGTIEPAEAQLNISFHETEDEFRIAAAAKAEEESLAAEEDLRRRTAMNDKKREIGAKLCKQRSDGFVEVAYTERVSPDNGKVQLRVSGAFDGRGFRRDVAEEIVWVDPTYWDLCE